MEKLKNKSLGSFLGLAIGDALGAPVEFSPKGTFKPVTKYRAGGPFNLPAGYWTDDTSMALCLADSIIYNKGLLNLGDQLNRYANWYLRGHNSSMGRCFDIGGGTEKVITSFLHTSEIRHYPESCGGNGSLMRVAPIPIAYSSRTERYVRDVTGLSSSLTHNRFASELTEEFAGLIHRALNNCEKSELHTNMVEVSEEQTTNGGYAPESLSSALYHFHSTDSFRGAVLQAVNFGNDADTIGAITGQLAGAYYGLSEIPVEWVAGLYNTEALRGVGELLYEMT